jgi:hypothetical protein
MRLVSLSILILGLIITTSLQAGGLQEGNPQVQVIVDPSRHLAASHISIANSQNKTVLKFTASNNTEYQVESFKAASIVGDKDLNILRGESWFKPHSIAPYSRQSFTFELSDPIKDGESITVILHPTLELAPSDEFSAAMLLEPEPQKPGDFVCNMATCESCTKEAITLCGAGNVKESECDLKACKCRTVCFDRVKPHTEPNKIDSALASRLFPMDPIGVLQNKYGIKGQSMDGKTLTPMQQKPNFSF